MKKTIHLVILILIAIAQFVAVLEAGVFATRTMSTNMSIQAMNLVNLAPPIYNATCTGIYRVSRGVIYYTGFDTLPSDWVMINGSLGARGFVGPGGYWGLVDYGYLGKGLRGFPLLWQVREHKTYNNSQWNPDIRFLPQSTNAIRIDSSAGAEPMGNGYLMIILPIELINETVIRNRFNAYFSYNDWRRVGFIDIVNEPVDRRSDTYFATYDSSEPPWQKYGKTYYRLYTINVKGPGTTSFDIINQTALQGYGPYVTYSYVLTDYWYYQSLYFDVFYILLNTTDNRVIYNFTFPYNTYSVVLERSGTYNDYGYLNYGFPGFTAFHLNTDLSSYTSLWFSTKINNRDGVGWGSILLIDSTKRNFYAIALNTSGYLVALRNSGVSWITITSSLVSGYKNNTWYALYINYTRSGGVNYVTAYLYDSSGNLVSQLSFSDSTFQPMYVGLGSYASNLLYIDVIYDDFLVSLTDPRYVVIINAPSHGYVAELYDSSGNRISRGVSDSSGRITLFSLIASVYGGLFKIYYPSNTLCLVTNFSYTLYVGDTYMISWSPIYIDTSARSVLFYIGYGGNTTYASVANISIYTGYSFYAYLQLDQSSGIISPGLSLEIYLANSTTISTDKIIIKGGSVVSSTTSMIYVSGSSNYIYVIGNYTSPGGSSYLRIHIVTCSSETKAVCLYTPISLTVAS